MSKYLLFALVGFSVIAFAGNSDTAFFDQLDPQPKQVLTTTLAGILPPYIAATQGVLNDIAALPAGTVSDQTKLADIPIPELFEKYDAQLINTGLFYQTAFGGGRTEEDIAWLKNSLKLLQELQALIQQSEDGQVVGAQIDKYLVNTQNFKSAQGGNEITASIGAASRFYCNLDIRISIVPSARLPFIEVSEDCD